MNTEKGGCVDIDECFQTRPPCTIEQFCVNNEGSYTCLGKNGIVGSVVDTKNHNYRQYLKNLVNFIFLQNVTNRVMDVLVMVQIFVTNVQMAMNYEMVFVLVSLK